MSQKATHKAPAVRSASDAVQAAKRHLLELTGQECESVSGIERDEDGWSVQAVVVEVRRIPSTTDILGVYDIRLDEPGEIQKCRRVSRYYRNQTLSDGGEM